jgi:hypothetical protein
MQRRVFYFARNCYGVPLRVQRIAGSLLTIFMIRMRSGKNSGLPGRKVLINTAQQNPPVERIMVVLLPRN